MDNIYCVAVEISPPEAAGIVAEPCHDADLVAAGLYHAWAIQDAST